MAELGIRTVRDSADIDLAITGLFVGDRLESWVILRPEEFKDEPAHVKLTGVFHSIQAGLLLTLWWEGANEHALMMPLEGRGILDLTRFGGLDNPRHDDATGAVVLVAEATTPGRKAFALSLEFSKQRI